MTPATAAPAPRKSWLDKARFGVDLVILLLRMSRLVFKPDDIGPIFRARSVRNHRSFQLALASLKADPGAAQLIAERYLAEKPYDLDVLGQLPEGTLGREFADHMRANKLALVFYPPLEDKEDDDITYVRKRARQTHDIHHVVLGLPAVDIGEMAISAFYLAQNRIPLSAMLLGVGFFVAIFREPERIDELVEAIIKGWGMGKRAKIFLGIRWEDYWEMPMPEVRRLLDVPA
ncbi:hypothetical protein J7643_18640 [bacterium]|nr:hypothetical protein [bacterium]